MSFLQKINKWPRKILKIFAWILASVIFLLIAAIILIQTDPVQNYIIQKATHYISDRTNTNVRIGHIRIKFPKTVVIENIFLDDKQKDTLLSAGKISIDVEMLALLKNKITIGELQIENLYANISNTEKDSLFNYDFLQKSFVQDTGIKITDTTSKPMEFIIGEVHLNNIRLSLNDRFHQSDLYGRIGEFKIDFDKFDLEKKTFVANTISLSESYFVKTDNNSIAVKDNSKSELPDIQFNKLIVKNVNGKIADYQNKDEFKFNVGNCEVIPDQIDLSKSLIHLNSILLSDSKIEIKSQKTDRVKTGSANNNNRWNIRTKKIELANAAFKMDVANVPEKKGFDPNHLDFRSINLNANNSVFVNENISTEINQLSFNEQNRFKLISLKSNVIFTNKQLTLDNLELLTSNSRIGNKIAIAYSSLDKIGEQISSVKVDINLNNSLIGTKDILYFNPQLASQSVFKNKRSIIVDTKITGRVDDLNIHEFFIRYGSQTSLNLKGHITGLPDINKTFADVSISGFNSGRKDLNPFTGDSAAKYIPEQIKGRFNYKGSLKNFNADLDLTSTSGNISANVNMLPGTENYHATLRLKDIDLRSILHDTTLGKVSMNIDAKGFSFDKSKAFADVEAKVLSAEYKNYRYEDLNIVAHVSDKFFEGNISMNDSNVAFDFNGKVDLHKDSEEFKFDFDLKAIDLYRLHLANKDIRLSAKANADLKGSSFNTFNGTAGITNLVIIQEGKNYSIDSVLYTSVNEKGKSSLSFTSAILSAKFEGTMVPGDIPKTIIQQLNNYFDIGDTIKSIQTAQNFSFEISVRDHPMLSEVLIPGLKEFEPVLIKGALNSSEKTFALTVDVPRFQYTGLNIHGLTCKLMADQQKIDYDLKLIEVSNESIKLATTDLNGNIQNDEILLNLLISDSTIEKLKLNAKLISLRQRDYRFQILPGGLSFNKQAWNVPEDNFIRFGRNGLLFNNFKLSSNQQLIAIHSPSQSVATEIAFEFKNFQLQTLSQLIEKDTSFVTGELSGDVQVNGKGNAGLTADLDIKSLTLHSIPVGDIKLKATKSGPVDYSGSLRLSRNENDVVVNGKFNGTNSIIDADVEINSLSMNSLSAFSGGQIRNGNGSVKGSVKITGPLPEPSVSGNLTFRDASFHSALANNHFTLKNEKLSFDNNGIYLSNFTIIDSTGNSAIINGKIEAENFSPKKYDLSLRLDHFTVLNTTSQDNKLFYGTLKLNSNTTITGNASLPRIYSKTKLLDMSYLNVTVPESKITNDRGDGVVIFIDPKQKINPILTRKTEEDITKTSIRGYAVTADLEVDKNSTLKIVVDPVSGDSLVVKGEGNLSFTMDASGKTSLTGLYTVTEGKYRVSLQELIHKDFTIKKGSTLNWSGDMMDADVNIDAVYERKTSPADLVAGQLGGLSDAERNKYKQNLPFQVILHIKGQMLKPDISFEIDLPEKYRSAMGGTVYAKLQQLNSDESELNKQVFALLVLGRFMQEDPLASNGGGGGIESAARTSVSKILSSQLNKLSDQYIKGVELDFDLQSFDDYSTGSVEEKTQLEVGIKKQLLDERLSVQVGSMVDLSDNGAKTGSSELASDITLEYKITDNGRYRLKVFRQNQYEDILDGPINVTGAGVIYTRDFDFWKNLFSKDEEKENDVTIPYKDE